MAHPSQILALYGDCVASLRSSLAFLESAVSTLADGGVAAAVGAAADPGATAAGTGGVQDMPRLAHVLASVRHYELLPQPTLAAAEASLQSDIGPAVAGLLDRAAHQLARQARRIDTLQAKAALQAGRLEGHERHHEERVAAARFRPAASSASSRPSSAPLADPLRARMVRQRREQLKYSIARLEREVAQKERELRQRLRQSTAGL